MVPFGPIHINLIPAAGVLLIVLASSLQRDPRRRWDDAATAIAYITYIGIGTQLNDVVVRLTPRTFDSQLLQADHALGFDPVGFAHTISQHKLLLIALQYVYLSLAAVIGIAWIAERDYRGRRAVVIAGVLCFIFYAVCPAVGPAIYDWSNNSAHDYARNCVPSMHLVWALLIAWNARSWPLRIVLWAYAILIAVATIAVGEHYLVDLIAAIPYSAFIQWLAVSRKSARQQLAAATPRTEIGGQAV